MHPYPEPGKQQPAGAQVLDVLHQKAKHNKCKSLELYIGKSGNPIPREKVESNAIVENHYCIMLFACEPA